MSGPGRFINSLEKGDNSSTENVQRHVVSSYNIRHPKIFDPWLGQED